MILKVFTNISPKKRMTFLTPKMAHSLAVQHKKAQTNKLVWAFINEINVSNLLLFQEYHFL